MIEVLDGQTIKGRVKPVLTFRGIDRVQVTEAGPGEIVLINGMADIGIGVTVTDPANPAPLPMLKVDEPTLTMNSASTPGRWPAAKASTSRAARSGIACRRNCNRTWRCA